MDIAKNKVVHSKIQGPNRSNHYFNSNSKKVKVFNQLVII